MPTDADMNAATLIMIADTFARPDVADRLLDELRRTRRLPLLTNIARMLDVPLAEVCNAFADEVEKRTGIRLRAIGLVNVQ